ncbi:hypothetical protein D3C80_786300 [compost metagenome]
MLLTADEVADLTGYQQPTAQVGWLVENNLSYLLGGDGKPKVLRALVVRRLGGEAESGPPAREPQLRL